MRYIVYHDGVPVAETTAKSRRELDWALWLPLVGFETIRPVLEAHWAAGEARRSARQDAPADDEAREAAIERGLDLADRLELRNGRGVRILTRLIQLFRVDDGSRVLGAAIVPTRPTLRVDDVIAERVLELATPEGPHRVVIRIGRPSRERVVAGGQESWRGAAEIISLPGEPRLVVGSGGSDAVQALLLTFQAVRNELLLAVADGAALTWLGSPDFGIPSMIGESETSIAELRRWRARRRARGATEQPPEQPPGEPTA